jgi:hypothetical protein
MRLGYNLLASQFLPKRIGVAPRKQNSSQKLHDIGATLAEFLKFLLFDKTKELLKSG